jgi:hypothetical protein
MTFWRDQRGFADAESLAICMVIVLVAAFGYGIVMGIYTLCCKVPPPPPTAEQQWVLRLRGRCNAMRAGLNYDDVEKIAECWRTPMLRHPKLMFREKYKGE